MVQADLIIPPIIVGLLIIMVFRVNAFIMETSVDNRLNNDVQTFAEVAATVIQEELKNVSGNVNVDNNQEVLTFTNMNDITVSIRRDGRNIIITSHDAIEDEENEGEFLDDVVTIPANLSNLQFVYEISNPVFLRVRVETESQPEQHVRFRNEEQTVRAFAERRIFMRNVAL